MPSDVSKFLCDNMLGRLARWLRFTGHDTHYYRDTNTAEMILIARNETRIILTRNTILSDIEDPKVILIHDGKVRDQMHQLHRELSLDMTPKPIFCPVCNGHLKTVEKNETIEHIVPEYTYKTQKIFHRCETCGKVYWKGTHVNRAQDFIN